MHEGNLTGAWFQRRQVVVDMVGLSAYEVIDEPNLACGPQSRMVTPGERYDLNEVGKVIFNWGDPAAVNLFSVLLEHDDSPKEASFPFDTATLIGDVVWLISLQPKEFDPHVAQKRDEDKIILPYDAAKAEEIMANYESMPGFRPPIYGYIASRWVLFELPFYTRDIDRDNYITEYKHSHSRAEYDVLEVINIATDIIDAWDFENETVEDSKRFVTIMGQWLVEMLGELQSDGNYAIAPSLIDLIDGEELPMDMQHLVAQTLSDTITFSNTNNVRLETGADYVKTKPEIPGWEVIQGLPSFNQQLDYILRHEDVLMGLNGSRYETTPEIRILFSPRKYTAEWGLEFTVSSQRVEVVPYGQPGETWRATEFVIDNGKNSRKMLRVVSELIILGAKNAEHYTRNRILSQDLDVLEQRLRTGESRDIRDPDEFDPEDALKDSLIKRAQNFGK
jgi:hypothetical protein